MHHYVFFIDASDQTCISGESTKPPLNLMMRVFCALALQGLHKTNEIVPSGLNGLKSTKNYPPRSWIVVSGDDRFR